MWARASELLLGAWLAAGPFVLRAGDVPLRAWLHDLGCAALVVGISLWSLRAREGRAYLLQLAVAGWLVARGWWGAWLDAGDPAAAVHQSWIAVGLSLAMFAIVPTRASVPPASWRRSASRGG